MGGGKELVERRRPQTRRYRGLVEFERARLPAAACLVRDSGDSGDDDAALPTSRVPRPRVLPSSAPPHAAPSTAQAEVRSFAAHPQSAAPHRYFQPSTRHRARPSKAPDHPHEPAKPSAALRRHFQPAPPPATKPPEHANRASKPPQSRFEPPHASRASKALFHAAPAPQHGAAVSPKTHPKHPSQPHEARLRSKPCLRSARLQAHPMKACAHARIR